MLGRHPQRPDLALPVAARVREHGRHLPGRDEQYRIQLTDPADIAIARQLLAGEEAPRIPNGLIVRGDDGGVNSGYTWHIDPDTLEFADFTTEVCDGLPSYVEDSTLSGDYFCPWSAEVIAIDE